MMMLMFDFIIFNTGACLEETQPNSQPALVLFEVTSFDFAISAVVLGGGGDLQKSHVSRTVCLLL